MNIQSTSYQPNFTARNLEIRQADKIMRNLMQEYPAFSTSRVKYYNSYKKHKPQVLNKVLPIFRRLEAERICLLKYDGITFVNKILEMVKREKNANCSEYAIMARAAFMANGFKDVRLGSLMIHSPKVNVQSPMPDKSADHRVLIVNAGKNAELDKPETFSKKAFIVDPWGGFCDYVSNAFNTYKGIFLRNLESEEEAAPKKFIFIEREPMEVTPKICSYMSNTHPELVIE